MKTLKYSLIALVAAFAASCSTDDVENRPVVEGIDAPVLLSPEEGNVYVLTEDNADVQAERFVWSAANFGEGIIPSYDLEIDYAGQEFDTPVIVASTNGTTQVSISNNVLNTAMEALLAPAEEPGTFQVRVKAYVADQVMYSNAIEISVTPYAGEVPLPQLFMVGSATETQWDNATGAPLFRDDSNEDETVFYFTGYFTAGDLKFLSTRGAWQPQYGSGGDGVLAVNDGTGSDPAAIAIAANGYYTVVVNTTAMTYSVTPFDASAAVVYPTIGVIGDATPTAWDSDTDMANSAANPHVWKVTNFTLGAGGVKFRANDGWDINWGSGTFPSGVATQNGANIPVIDEQAGTYEVWFNDLDGRYIFVPVN